MSSLLRLLLRLDRGHQLDDLLLFLVGRGRAGGMQSRSRCAAARLSRRRVTARAAARRSARQPDRARAWPHRLRHSAQRLGHGRRRQLGGITVRRIPGFCCSRRQPQNAWLMRSICATSLDFGAPCAISWPDLACPPLLARCSALLAQLVEHACLCRSISSALSSRTPRATGS